MKPLACRHLPLKILLGGFLSFSAHGQGSLGTGTFQDLDFESANLSPIPPGQFGGPSVAATDAIPGWTAYIAAAPVSSIQQDDVTTGSASVNIFGPKGAAGDFGGYVIEGLYSIGLQPGFLTGSNVGSSIAQTAQIPSGAASLLFKASPFDPFVISLGGQALSCVALGAGPNYTLYGASLPAGVGGQTETLSIAVAAGPNNIGDIFDSFSFSPSSIPEPNILPLFGLGGLAMLLVFRVKRA